MPQLRRGGLELCVLAILANRATYGFDLIRRLSEVDGVVATEGAVYPLLARLRRQGRVETRWRESQSGPPRRYYRLSDSGALSLRVLKAEWQAFRDAVDATLAMPERQVGR